MKPSIPTVSLFLFLALLRKICLILIYWKLASYANKVEQLLLLKLVQPFFLY